LEVWNIPVFPVQWALRSMVSLSALSGREARAAWWDHSPALFAKPDCGHASRGGNLMEVMHDWRVEVHAFSLRRFPPALPVVDALSIVRIIHGNVHIS